MWFRVDDKFHSHNKVRKVLADDPAALALWVVAGSWSSDNLEDGFVPDHQLQWLIPTGADALAQKLVAARLWRRVRGGYQFHDFTDWNKSREQVLAEREARAEAGRKGGANSGKSRSKRQANASASDSANAKQKRTHTLPDQEESSTNSLSSDADERFEEFWRIYPPRKNNSKHKARIAYLASLKRGVDPTEILAALEVYARERHGEDQQYTKHAVTWLHARPWEEPEPLVPPPRAKFAWEN